MIARFNHLGPEAMVKPAGPFLDIVSRVKAETGYPVAAYQVRESRSASVSSTASL